jgi:hypothetical protein
MTIQLPNYIEIEKVDYDEDEDLEHWMWHAFGSQGEVLNARVGLESVEAARQSIREVYGSTAPKPNVKR